MPQMLKNTHLIIFRTYSTSKVWCNYKDLTLEVSVVQMNDSRKQWSIFFLLNILNITRICDLLTDFGCNKDHQYSSRLISYTNQPLNAAFTCFFTLGEVDDFSKYSNEIFMRYDMISSVIRYTRPLDGSVSDVTLNVSRWHDLMYYDVGMLIH